MESERRKIKETSLLSQSRKGPKTCYGATRNPESTADYKLLTHELTLSDTLQGLAIKYSVTVEQIRRANKLWTNDNIHILRTINIPVKLKFDDKLGDGLVNNHNPGASRDAKVCTHQECDSEESVDSGVHEVNHGDISVDTEGHSRGASRSPVKTKKGASDSLDNTLNSFLKKFDGEMKASIQKAKKQRATNAGQVLINNMEADHEKERAKRHKQIDSNHVKLKSSRVSIAQRNSQSDNGSLDELFEL